MLHMSNRQTGRLRLRVDLEARARTGQPTMRWVVGPVGAEAPCRIVWLIIAPSLGATGRRRSCDRATMSRPRSTHGHKLPILSSPARPRRSFGSGALKQALLHLLAGQAHRQPAAMSSTGSLQRKCVKGHPKTAGKCSGRCIRCYPRLDSAGRRAEGTWRETQPPNPT
jgi:hypothetical protein